MTFVAPPVGGGVNSRLCWQRLHALWLIAMVVLVAGCSRRLEGPSATVEHLSYVALGDSLTQQPGGFAEQYTAYLDADLRTTTTLTNLGQSGWTSSFLLTAVQSDERFRAAIREADLITVEIGLNDWGTARSWYLDPSKGCYQDLNCFRTFTDQFKANVDATLTEIRQLNPSSTLAILVMDLYYAHIETDQQSGNYALFDPYMREMNEHIYASAPANGTRVAVTRPTINGIDGNQSGQLQDFLTLDGHPKDKGATVIANKFRDIGYGGRN